MPSEDYFKGAQESLLQAIEEGRLEEDAFWVYQALGYIDSHGGDENKEMVASVHEKAPTPGASGLLLYALKYRKDFYKEFATRALNRKGKDTAMRDDGRKRLEIFDQAHSFFNEKYLAERKCPACGRRLGKDAVLFPRP